MICLKNRTFAVSQTTYKGVGISLELLWFAWKIVLLQYRKQQRSLIILHTSGCDLLEKSYFCSIANNKRPTIPRTPSVVICLKNRTFAVSQTTLKCTLLKMGGCDLLEKSYFCSIANNKELINTTQRYVVICLKNRTFAVSQTTSNIPGMFMLPLWFAWKIVLLQYRKQPDRRLARTAVGCDLLEKSYFCSIANNTRPCRWWRPSGCDLLEKSYFCSIANNRFNWS